MSASKDVEIEKLYSKGTKQIEELKKIILKQEEQIRKLEERLTELEKRND